MPVKGIPVSKVARVYLNGRMERVVIQGGEETYRAEVPDVGQVKGEDVMTHTGWGETPDEAMGGLCDNLTHLGFTVMVECPVCTERGLPMFSECQGCGGGGFVTFERNLELREKMALEDTAAGGEEDGDEEEV